MLCSLVSGRSARSSKMRLALIWRICFLMWKMFAFCGIRHLLCHKNRCMQETVAAAPHDQSMTQKQRNEFMFKGLQKYRQNYHVYTRAFRGRLCQRDWFTIQWSLNTCKGRERGWCDCLKALVSAIITDA